MNWDVLIPIIAQEGLPLAEALFQKWTTGNPPTQFDFDELRALSARQAQDRMLAMLNQAGVDSSDPKYAKLLELAKGVPNLVVAPPPPPPGTPPAPAVWKES